ncbi:MAG: hypothetical protein KAG98_00875 [Lentisphaeria bacterium]|nr:hypothetical protein [Lentisphaeria bacterium]
MEVSLIKFIVSFTVVVLSIFMVLAGRDLTKTDNRWKGKKEELLPCKKCGDKFIHLHSSDKQTCPYCNHPVN